MCKKLISKKYSRCPRSRLPDVAIFPPKCSNLDQFSSHSKNNVCLFPPNCLSLKIFQLWPIYDFLAFYRNFWLLMVTKIWQLCYVYCVVHLSSMSTHVRSRQIGSSQTKKSRYSIYRQKQMEFQRTASASKLISRNTNRCQSDFLYLCIHEVAKFPLDSTCIQFTL